MKKENNNEQIITKINEVLNKIRPYLQNDGGDVKFEKFENSIRWFNNGTFKTTLSTSFLISNTIFIVLLEPFCKL